MNSPRQCSQEEINALREMNTKYWYDANTTTLRGNWTPVKFEDNTASKLVDGLVQLKTLDKGSFFSRVWFLRDKESNKIIGIIDSTGLDEDGYSEISIRLLKSTRRKGFASEAVNGLIDHFRQFKEHKFECLPQDALREKACTIISELSDALPTPEMGQQFIEARRLTGEFPTGFQAPPQ